MEMGLIAGVARFDAEILRTSEFITRYDSFLKMTCQSVTSFRECRIKYLQ